MADCVYIDNVAACHHQEIQNGCNGQPNHAQHPHAHYTVYLSLGAQCRPQPADAFTAIVFNPSACKLVKNLFTSCIWQPPKVATLPHDSWQTKR